LGLVSNNFEGVIGQHQNILFACGLLKMFISNSYGTAEGIKLKLSQLVERDIGK